MSTCTQPFAAVLCAAALTVVSAQASAAPPAPVPQTDEQLGFYGGTRDEVLARCKRVGVIPVAKPPLPGVDPDASVRLDAAVMRALQAAGLEVVGSDSYTKAYDRFNKAVGGAFDPMSGAPRKEVTSSVYQNAVRDFFTQDQLGCIALTRPVAVKANDSGNYATWDGAIEYVDGQANSTFSRIMLGNSGGTGSLGAVSVIVQLYNAEGKVLYGRAGGVQLTAYFDRQHGAQNSDFLSVPRAKLLLDDKRIERALNHATAPLRYTPAEIAAGDKNPAINTLAISPGSLPPPPPGSVGQEESPLLVPREQILSSIHRVVLGPLLTNGFTPSAELATNYRAQIHERLAKLGWDVVDSAQLHAAFGAAVRQVGGFYDPMTGKVDPDRLRSSMQAALKALSLPSPPDGIVVMGLVKTTATQKYGNAAWDGAEQNALNLGPAIHHGKLFGGTEDGTAGESRISASSLYFLLRDANGTVLYESRGGIQLLQQLSLTALRSYRTINYQQNFADLAPTELFKDPERNAGALDIVLRELVMSAEEIAAQRAAQLKTAKH
ncbi:MAG TPA: hypothetical protein VGI65_04510 [Steroidobacteraceae bacterium]